MKKSFLLMRDLLDSIELMTDNEAGLLFKAIIDHVDGKVVTLPRELQFAFTPIRNQLSRDEEKYHSICERNRINGLKGGRPKNPENPVGLLGTQKKRVEPKKAHTDTDTDTDTEKKKAVTKKKTVYPDWLDQEAWGDWTQHRKEIRRPMTALAESKGINKLKSLLNGVSQRQIIDHCIANGYQGLFAPDRKSSGNGKDSSASRFLENLKNA